MPAFTLDESKARAWLAHQPDPDNDDGTYKLWIHDTWHPLIERPIEVEDMVDDVMAAGEAAGLAGLDGHTFALLISSDDDEGEHLYSVVLDVPTEAEDGAPLRLSSQRKRIKTQLAPSMTGIDAAYDVLAQVVNEANQLADALDAHIIGILEG